MRYWYLDYSKIDFLCPYNVLMSLSKEDLEYYNHNIGCRHNLYEVIYMIDTPYRLFECSLIDAAWIVKNFRGWSKQFYRLSNNASLTPEVVLDLLQNGGFHESMIRVFTFEQCVALCDKYPILSKSIVYFDDPRVIKISNILSHLSKTYIKYASQEDIEEILEQTPSYYDSCHTRTSLIPVCKNVSVLTMATPMLPHHYTEIQLGYVRAMFPELNLPMMIHDDMWQLVADDPHGNWLLHSIKHDNTWRKLVPYLLEAHRYISSVPTHMLHDYYYVEDIIHMRIGTNLSPETAQIYLMQHPEYSLKYQSFVRWDFIKAHPEMRWNYDELLLDVNIAEAIAIAGKVPMLLYDAGDSDYNVIPPSLIESAICYKNHRHTNNIIKTAVDKMRKLQRLGVSLWARRMAFADICIKH